MMIKVKPTLNMEGSCTWTSYFVRFLLKICFFPVYIEGQKVRFSFISLKTPVHIATNIGVFSSLYIIGMITSGWDAVLTDKLSLVKVIFKQA